MMLDLLRPWSERESVSAVSIANILMYEEAKVATDACRRNFPAT